MDSRDFTSTFLDILRSGDHVLDIGGGQGEFALKFVDRGAQVTIVDPKATAQNNKQITIKPITIEEFCATDKLGIYDAIFARNVIQFLDRSWVFEKLLPWMNSHLKNNGVIAIKTFYQNPEPPFARPVPSFYGLNELQKYFMNWHELLAAQYSHRGSDMSGEIRQFFTTDLIVRKP